MSKVAIVRCDSYDQSLVDQAVKTICKEADMPSVRGKRVLLKPNILSDAKPDACITTHPQVVRSLVRLLKQEGVQTLYIGDSPGLQKPNFQARASGIQAICEEENIQWVDFTKHPKLYTIPFSRSKQLPLASILEEVDMVFSLPKFKTHQLMYTTGAIKNLFGLVPNLYKSPCHVQVPTREQFASLMVGICSLVKPSFSLMDGIIAMEGPGPANGIPKHLGLLLASCDALSLDYVQAQIMGYNPLDIPIIREGIHRGLGSMQIAFPLLDAKDLVVEKYQRIAVHKKTSFLQSLILPFFFSRYIRWKVKRDRNAPVFLDDLCIGCKKCMDICPAQALTMQDKHIIIDVQECIRCYCCHEVCPASAILVEEN